MLNVQNRKHDLAEILLSPDNQGASKTHVDPLKVCLLSALVKEQYFVQLVDLWHAAFSCLNNGGVISDEKAGIMHLGHISSLPHWQGHRDRASRAKLRYIAGPLRLLQFFEQKVREEFIPTTLIFFAHGLWKSIVGMSAANCRGHMLSKAHDVSI